MSKIKNNEKTLGLKKFYVNIFVTFFFKMSLKKRENMVQFPKVRNFCYVPWQIGIILSVVLILATYRNASWLLFHYYLKFDIINDKSLK